MGISYKILLPNNLQASTTFDQQPNETLPQDYPVQDFRRTPVTRPTLWNVHSKGHTGTELISVVCEMKMGVM